MVGSHRTEIPTGVLPIYPLFSRGQTPSGRLSGGSRRVLGEILAEAVGPPATRTRIPVKAGPHPASKEIVYPAIRLSMHTKTPCLRTRKPCCLSAGFRQEDRYDPLGFLLVLRVGRVRLNRDVPEALPLGRIHHLPDPHRMDFSAVPDLNVRFRL